MSKISPCLCSTASERGREVLRFAAAGLRIENPEETVDSPAGKAGSCWWWTSRWRPALHGAHGGTGFEYTHAISFKIDCAISRSRPSLDALSANGGSVEQCGWLKDCSGVVADRAGRAAAISRGSDPAGAQRAMQAMMQMVKLDIEGLRKL